MTITRISVNKTVQNVEDILQQEEHSTVVKDAVDSLIGVIQCMRAFISQ